MQVGNLLNLMNDAGDLLEIFEGVDNREQLISRLEMLKRKGTDDLLTDLSGLRHSLQTLANDVLEVGTSILEPGDLPDSSDADLEKFLALSDDKNSDSKKNTGEENTSQDEKSAVRSP